MGPSPIAVVVVVETSPNNFRASQASTHLRRGHQSRVAKKAGDWLRWGSKSATWGHFAWLSRRMEVFGKKPACNGQNDESELAKLLSNSTV